MENRNNYRVIASILKMSELINSRIKASKYIHIMFNDKFNKPTVDFLNKNFDSKEHLILCRKIFENFPFPEGENVLEIITFDFLQFYEYNRIICHSLFDPLLVNFLYRNKIYIDNNTYWLIWGGDLYNSLDDEINIYVRSHMKGYCSAIDGDEKIAMNKFNKSCTELYYTPVKSPTATSLLIGKRKIYHDYIKIQVNNSADVSTLEMFSILRKFYNNNIKISTILSYGNMQYKDRIIKLGKHYFGDNFEYIDTFLPANDYIEYMRTVDILVMNQDRQQGCGNAKIAAYLGAKVYIKKHLTHFNYYMSRGIQVYDTCEIKNMDFSQFIEYNDSVVENNRKQIEYYFSDDKAKELWGKFFEAIR